KKGISSYQLAKDVGITQKSAWFVLQRLRYTFKSPIFETMLDGLIEIDETFVPVLGIIERNGNLITQVIPNTQQQTIEPIIKAKVKKGSDVYTDE
ncbi:44_t:CDS:2, partial [Ambispora leptoticha]